MRAFEAVVALLDQIQVCFCPVCIALRTNLTSKVALVGGFVF